MKTCNSYFRNEKMRLGGDFRLYKKIAIAMAILYFIVFIVFTVTFANIIQTEVFGKGDLYVRSSSPQTIDIAGAKNASFIYNYERIWDSEKNIGYSEFFVTKAKGTFEDQYIVRGKAAGHVVEYTASNIMDSFSGKRTFSIILEDTGEQFDNLFFIKGNATLTGKIRGIEKGQPENLEDLFVKGEIILREYINVSSEPQTPEDWLEFCAWIEEKLK